MSIRQGSALTTSEDEYKMVPFAENFEISCGTMARLLNQFNVDDALAEIDGGSFDTEECTFWHNVMYDYCGFCEEPPPRDDLACEFPCDFDDVIVPESFSDENFQCVFNYFDSLVLTEEDQERCLPILADSRRCCKSDGKRSKKKKKAGMSVKSGKMTKKNKNKAMSMMFMMGAGGKMKTKTMGKRLLVSEPPIDAVHGKRVLQLLRKMLPTDISTAQTD